MITPRKIGTLKGTLPQSRVPLDDKTVDELALEVIRGLWGSGDERVRLLTESGYDYDAVQKRVNELMQ